LVKGGEKKQGSNELHDKQGNGRTEREVGVTKRGGDLGGTKKKENKEIFHKGCRSKEKTQTDSPLSAQKKKKTSPLGSHLKGGEAREEW